MLFSHLLPPVLSCHHTPSQAHNLHTRQDEGLLTYSLSGLQKGPRRDTLPCIQKPPPSPGVGLSLATLPLAFSQTEKQGNTCLSPGHQAKHPPSLGQPHCSWLWLCHCPFLPFLLHITHVSHQTSYQSLQQMHSLPPGREKAATTQSSNLITVCNELTGKYFCLIRILNELLIIMSGSWLASCFVPSVMAAQLLASPCSSSPQPSRKRYSHSSPTCTAPWQQQKRNTAGINISALAVNQGLSFLLLGKNL